MEPTSRAQRRRNARNSNSSAHKERGPLRALYLAIAIVLALVFAGFGVSNWLQNRAQQRAVAFDVSTPTPGPSAGRRNATRLRDGESLGLATAFPRADLQHGIAADTSLGGRGAAIDGIPCQAEMVRIHVHSHLALYVNGKQIQVPGAIGIVPTPQGGCLYWLHTHGPDGIIHVEAVTPDAPQGGHYTLGMFFDIWGMPLSAGQMGPFKGKVTGFVDGAHYTGDPRGIPLRAHELITLEVGRPLAQPPIYAFPPGD